MVEKPYDRCIACPNIGQKCDGPNFLAMSVERWVEWCRKRKDWLGWTNWQISELSDVPESTVNRIFSGNSRDLRVSTMQMITKALVNGTWGQYPCANPDARSEEEWTALQHECEEKKKELERLNHIFDNLEADNKRKVDYLKGLVEDGKRAVKTHRIAIVALAAILVIVLALDAALPLFGWIQY